MKKTKKYTSISAVLSEDLRYRYTLVREWDPAKLKVTFLMVNPSTADHQIDDATIRKCVGFADAWGYGGIIVVNLFALRSREPKALLTADDPIGPDNDAHLLERVSAPGPFVVAWGCDDTLKRRKLLMDRRDSVLARLQEVRPGEILCLGTTMGGAPKHPLMLAYTTPLVPYHIPTVVAA